MGIEWWSLEYVLVIGGVELVGDRELYAPNR